MGAAAAGPRLHRSPPRGAVTHAGPLVAVTAGEPAGIGPELCVQLAHRDLPARVVIVAERALLIGIDTELIDFNAEGRVAERRGSLLVRHVPLKVPSIAGRLDTANAAYVIRTLEAATDGCMDGTFASMA